MRVLIGCFLIMIGLSLFTGCLQQPMPEETVTPGSPVPVWIGTLPPYFTPTTSPTFKPPTDLPEIPSTRIPSPTPFLHQVKKGETMLGIAIQYGITLEDLQAANPDADPRLLSVDQTLTIPIRLTEDSSVPVATPTPYKVVIDSPRCFTSDQGLACITEITNSQPVALESIRVGFGLYNIEDELLSSEVGITALNRLLPGKKMPVTAVFMDFPAGSQSGDTYVHAELLTAFAAQESEFRRYVDAEVEVIEPIIFTSKFSAEVSGLIHFQSPASQVWVSGVAFDQQGQAVGMRKWKINPGCTEQPVVLDTEAVIETATLTTEPAKECPPVEFQFLVYSLGPEIDQVKVFAEARP